MSNQMFRSAVSTSSARRRIDRTTQELESLIDVAQSNEAKAAIRWAISNLGRGIGRVRRTPHTKQNETKKNLRRKMQNDHLRDKAGNNRQPWTETHDRLVLDWLGKDSDLALEIGRSASAITYRRWLLNKNKCQEAGS